MEKKPFQNSVDYVLMNVLPGDKTLLFNPVALRTAKTP